MKPYADMSDTEFAEWAAVKVCGAQGVNVMDGRVYAHGGCCVGFERVWSPRADANDALAMVDAYCDNHDRLWRGARAPGGTADRPLQDRFVCDLVPRGAAEPFSVIADGDTFAAAICAAVYAAVEGE